MVERVRSRTIAAHAELVAKAASVDAALASHLHEPVAETTTMDPLVEEPDSVVEKPAMGADENELFSDPARDSSHAADPGAARAPDSAQEFPLDERQPSEAQTGFRPEDPAPGAPIPMEPNPTIESPTFGYPSEREGEGTEFVPAHTNVVGGRNLLDALPDRDAAAIVRAQLLDVIEAEGPIELGRLVRIVGRRFNLNAVRAARADDIARLVPRAQLRKSRKFGNFAWPVGLDPENWKGFRIANFHVTRTLDEVAPEEIANAMLAILMEHPELEYVDDVLRRTAELFGIARLGAHVRTRLEAIYEGLPDESEELPGDTAEGMSSAAGGQSVPDQPEDRADLPSTTPEGSDPGLESGVVLSPTTPASSDVVSSPRPMAPNREDPIIERVADEVDQYVPDLSKVEQHMYYDFVAQMPLGPNSGDRRRNREDPRYDGSPGYKGVGGKASHLSIDDAHAVGNAASMIWGETVGMRSAAPPNKLAVHLAQDPEFDPLPWEEDINDFVAAACPDSALAWWHLTQRQLNYYAHETGLIAKVEAEIHRDARAALAAMSPLERESTALRVATRNVFSWPSPSLSSRREPASLSSTGCRGSNVRNLDSSARRATPRRSADWRLRARRERPSHASSGFPAPIMDRVERENRSDILLQPDDPIVTDLAPSLL